MPRLTLELLHAAPERLNPLGDRELVLRGAFRWRETTWNTRD